MIEGASASRSFDGNERGEQERGESRGSVEAKRPWIDDLNTA